MPDVTKVLEVDVDISAHECAEIFWDMDSEQQAKFFDRLGEISFGHDLRSQMDSVRREEALGRFGKSTMTIIGEDR